MEAPCSSTMFGSSVPTRRVASAKVPVEVEVERWVEEDGREAGPGGRLLGLGPATVPLALVAQAGDEADHAPAPVPEVEEGARAPDRLVVGMGRHVQNRRGHDQEITRSGTGRPLVVSAVRGRVPLCQLPELFWDPVLRGQSDRGVPDGGSSELLPDRVHGPVDAPTVGLHDGTDFRPLMSTPGRR